KAQVPNLDDFKFTNQSQLNSYLKGFNTPESLFESLLFDRNNTDKWSVIFDDFITLENLLNGISLHNGMEFGLVHVSNNNTDIFGYVRYVLPNTDAEQKGVLRGMVFNSVNGTPLTMNNFSSLLFSNNNSYSIGLATYNNDGTVTATNQTINLDKIEYQENPIFLSNVITRGSHKIGYLMYNGFFSGFDNQLNTTILNLKNQGITELVLDLRYNGGGSVRTASFLASMITGQFTNQLFTKEHWNANLQKQFEDHNPEFLVNNFSAKLADNTAINHLNLDKLYVITTGSTASASELVINGLNPYITVKSIGTKTVGKYVASIKVYDSKDLGRAGANPNHTYAMQPIVLEELNKLDFNDKDGFDPTILLPEDYGNLGILGDENEPLFKATLDLISTGGKLISAQKELFLEKPFSGSNEQKLKQTMVVDKKINNNQ
ncbi:MAG: peptidase S41, partial [Flavobacteriales bacterium CG11_big_fil_rev_8_21_14_0_20_35_7]